MGKSKVLEDKMRRRIVEEELKEFQDLIKGHKKLLFAIGRL